MVNNASVREHYKSMVPDQVSHKLFWKRYFFKVHLIELQEARRNVLKKRAEEATKEADSGEARLFLRLLRSLQTQRSTICVYNLHSCLNLSSQI